MVSMKGFTDPHDKQVNDLLGIIERLGLNASNIGDITEHVKEVVSMFESLSEGQRRNFLGSLLFNYAGYYNESRKAMSKAEYCRQYHSR